MPLRWWLRAASCTAWLLVFTLLVGCSGGGSDGGGGSAAPAPTANAGDDEMAAVGVPVALDGSASDSPTGAPVSYQWTLSGKPAGSTAFLTNPTSVRPAFTPDVAGSYTATLVVQASGVPSAPDAVAITAVTGNVAPRADVGPDANAAPSRPITLDGSASRDPNNTKVTYSWRIVEQPPGSHPTLTNATSAKPTFTADEPGRYVLALTCSDGSMTSTVDQVVIIVATGNLPPVANAGPDQTVTVGQLVTLNGTGSSDPNGDPLTYSWCLRGRPEGSTATLSGANTAHPTFTPDVAGSYVLCLTVNDGNASSTSDSVVVEARVAPFNQGSGFNGTVTDIVLVQDGSRDVYVGGDFTAYKGTVANHLVRLHPDGTVAQRYGQVNGFSHIALAKTGELYVLGLTEFDGQPVPPLIRLTSDGSLDPGFQLPTEFNPFTGPLFGPFPPIVAAEDGSGDLYVTFKKLNAVPTSPVDNGLINIARLNADGTVDPAFSTRDGFPTQSGARGEPQTILAMLPTSSGKLYVAGGLYSFNGVRVSSLIRLNPDGTLDPTFNADVGGPPSSGVPNILDIVPAGDGTSDLYASRWVSPLLRVQETGAFDTSTVDVSFRPDAIAVAQDGTGDVLGSAGSPQSLFRLKWRGTLVSAPSFIRPTLNGSVITIVPLQDGTGDFYIGGLFTSYNGAAVNHFARIHADGSLASVVSGP